MKSGSINQQEVPGILNSSWLRAAYLALHSEVTTANMVALAGALLAILMLIALHEPWNIRIPLYLTVLVWTILRPRTALYLMPLAVPWGSLDYIDVKGLRMNSADILVAFLAIGWLMSFALRRNQPQATTEQAVIGEQPSTGNYLAGPLDRALSNVPVYLVLAILVLLATMLLSMTVAININSSLKEIVKWLEFLVLVLLGIHYIRTRRQIWTIIILTCLAGITQALFGYIQFFFNLGPASFVRDASLRIYGTFDQPNPYAGYINLPLSIALALMLLGSNWKTRILAGTTAVLLATAELLTQSRGGEIAIVAALVFIIVVGMFRLRIFIGLLAVAALGAIEAILVGLIPVYIFNPLLARLGIIGISLMYPNNQTFSTAERLAHWIVGLHMFFDHPLLGVGIGNYPDAYPHYFVTIFTDPLGHAHNYYINIAAETGSIGLIAYLLFLLAIFFAGAHSYRLITGKYKQVKLQTQVSQTQVRATRPPGMSDALSSQMRSSHMAQYPRHHKSHEIINMLINDRALSIGLLAALVSVCVHNLVDSLYVHSLTNLMALLLITLIRL